MRLKFWKREKKETIINVVNYVPIHHDVDELTKEDQCHGKLKSGARCSRVVKNGMYCYQHKRS